MIFSDIVGHYRRLRDWLQGREAHDRTMELTGAMLSRLVRAQHEVSSLHDVEFRVYSQFGDDGIIQWLTGRLPGLAKRFVEFGVEDYTESTTRFLMVNDNWSGLVMDGSASNIKRLKARRWFWRYDLTARHCFLTRENVDAVLTEWAGNEPVGLLHVDVDGNDYWLWDAIECISPGIVVIEYNAVLGPDRAITIPYSADFRRHAAHPSGQYAGASLGALAHLAARKGYALVGTNNAGNNAYFVRRELLAEGLSEVPVAHAFGMSKFRESRNASGKLNFDSFEQRQSRIRGLPVWNVSKNQIEPF